MKLEFFKLEEFKSLNMELELWSVNFYTYLSFQNLSTVYVMVAEEKENWFGDTDKDRERSRKLEMLHRWIGSWGWWQKEWDPTGNIYVKELELCGDICITLYLTFISTSNIYIVLKFTTLQ